MSLIICDHESGQKCVVDPATQTYQIIPVSSNKFWMKGYPFDFFESVDEFRESGSKAAVIPFYCSNRKIKGKRYFVDLLCRAETTQIFNVEMTDGNWVKNESDKKGWDKAAPKTGIEICIPGQAYFIYVVKENTNSGFRIKSVMPIKKTS